MKNRRLVSFVYVLVWLLITSGCTLAQVPSTSNVRLPNVMRFCAYNCFLLQLNDGHYDGYTVDARHDLTARYTVVRFTPDAIELDRSDFGGDHAVLTGKMSPDREYVVDGQIKWEKTGGTGPFQLSWGSSLAKAVKLTPPPPKKGPNTTCADMWTAARNKEWNVSESEQRQIALRELPGKHAPGHYNLNGTWAQRECVTLGNDLRAAEYSIVQEGDTVTMTVLTPRLPTTGQVVFSGTYSENQKVVGTSAFNKASSPQHPVMGPDIMAVENPDSLRLAGLNSQLIRISLTGIDDAPCDLKSPPHTFVDFAQGRALDAISFRKDYAKAACWLNAAAFAGDKSAPGLLALLYYQGLGVEKDYTKAFTLANYSATHGDSIGQSALALIYATGKGAQRNPALSSFWFERARSSADALEYLTWTPNMLMSVSPDTPLAETGAIPPILLPTGANPGQPLTKSLDCTPENAKGLDDKELWSRSQIAFGGRELTQSLCWAFPSALKGNVDAMHLLAWAFDRGVGVEHRNQAAVFWATRLAKSGDLYGQARLAVLYGQGVEVQRNDALSAQWAKAATAQPGGQLLIDLFVNEESRITKDFNLNPVFTYVSDSLGSCNASGTNRAANDISNANCEARRKEQESTQARYARNEWEQQRAEAMAPVSDEEEKSIDLKLIMASLRPGK